MIVTTTNSIEGSPIREYRGIVFGEVITGINVFKDIGAGLRNFFGGRSAGYEEELQNARNEALDEMCRRAEHGQRLRHRRGRLKAAASKKTAAPRLRGRCGFLFSGLIPRR